ncbi:TPA: hypothetical protein ACOEPF_000648 [Stenotrophomonas maltophilia]|jgi:hypothetical protein|uniref:hypothetical protein n=1 Tax=Stenotrophomonas TaxID=40323 RepID=UPI0024491F02|nr:MULTISPECIES: hypothetical protein [Stenotrophomonas]MBN5024688.1 hypothetical protein [Stenotrophomonas maltophilia]MDH1483624.1 hypothetical protein [Stenotrophomonas sp. GD03712]WON69564.1 hypothetical protein RWT08_04255 [Stenotrophomonas maltophilia]HDS1101045.1 hypothetical protein [Stenotrophomonas maltophilia]HDS1107127.1 hypothetical protein [Stenotrophomonas maltophilia]
MADPLLTANSPRGPSALGREAAHVALDRSQAELHSVALAADHALRAKLDRHTIDRGGVREDAFNVAGDRHQQTVPVEHSAQGSVEAKGAHRQGAVLNVRHFNDEYAKSEVSGLAADQLLTAAQAKHKARVFLSEARARRNGLGFWFAFNAAQRARMRAAAPALLPASPRAPALPAQLDLFA